MPALVVKLGSSVIAEDSGELRLSVVARVCEEVAALRAAGADVVVVTSGAIARGIRLMGLPLRPTAIEELQAAGVEPDIWKIEGLDKREDCQAVAELARSGGRDNVACVVLGRGADDQAVEHWLKQGAGVPGYVGFAIGRTIWWDALKAYLAEELSREDAASKISANYRRFIDVYNS